MRYTISFIVNIFKHQFIKAIFIVFVVTFVTSCGDDTTTSGVDEKILDDFTISVPTSWPLVSKDSDGVPKPSSGNIVLIASSNEAKNGFANNMTILERGVSGYTSSKEFTIANKTGIEKQFYSYTEIESGDIQFYDEEFSHISIFRARYNKNTPTVNYLQTSRICNNKAFTITISVGVDVQDFSRYKALLSTFQCKSEK